MIVLSKSSSAVREQSGLVIVRLNISSRPEIKVMWGTAGHWLSVREASVLQGRVFTLAHVRVQTSPDRSTKVHQDHSDSHVRFTRMLSLIRSVLLLWPLGVSAQLRSLSLTTRRPFLDFDSDAILASVKALTKIGKHPVMTMAGMVAYEQAKRLLRSMSLILCVELDS